MAHGIETAIESVELTSWLEKKGMEIRIEKKGEEYKFKEFTHGEYALELHKIWEKYSSNNEPPIFCEVKISEWGLIEASLRSLDSLVEYHTNEAEQLALWLRSNRHKINEKLDGKNASELNKGVIDSLATFYMSQSSKDTKKMLCERYGEIRRSSRY